MLADCLQVRIATEIFEVQTKIICMKGEKTLTPEKLE